MTRADSDQVLSDLSARQLQVAALLVRGLSSREISDRLLVSDPLIRAETKQILNKLGPDSVGTRAKLAVGLGWQNPLI